MVEDVLSSDSRLYDSDMTMPTVEAILEEKNKQIAQLRKQVLNQRTQLEFYIRKELHTPQMIDFSRNCYAQPSPDDIKTALAINKFNKEFGIKSRAMQLYEKINKIDNDARRSITSVENVVADVLKRIQAIIGPKDIQHFLENFDVNSGYIELFNKLVNSMVDLNKNVFNLKNCCERLVTSEEKRSALVEQVYSLPLEERNICNYLIGVQMEKFELENVIKDLPRKHKKVLSIDEMDTFENNLKLLYHKFGHRYAANTDQSVSLMLDEIYSEAMSLLALSREQKQNYTKEVTHIKEENEKLREVIYNLDSKNKDSKSGMNHIADVQNLHNIIKKTLCYVKGNGVEKRENMEGKIMEKISS